MKFLGRHTLAFALALGAVGCADRRISLLDSELAPQPSPAGSTAAEAGSAGSATMGQAGRVSSAVAGTSAVAGRASSGAAGAGGQVLPQAGRSPEDGQIEGLVLRYDFAGEGNTNVADRVGDADAVLMGDAFLERGRAFLDGDDDYIDMPNGVLSQLQSATIVAWVTWNGGYCWQRVFDFGVSTSGEDAVGTVDTSLFLTPYACGIEASMGMAEFGRIQYQVYDNRRFPTGRALQVALVVDPKRQSLRMYIDAELIGEAPAPFALADIKDVNNWLGRSQWVQDSADFAGSYDDFRIYGRPLGGDEIAVLYERGPGGL